MLAVQVQYFNYLETQRHNLVTEQQGAETLEQGRESLRIQDFNSQTQRRSQEEQARHNVASETISLASLHETERHNKVYEQETQRHNLAQEAIGRTQAEASTLSAQASMKQAQSSALSAQASMTSAQAAMKNATLNETKWNTSEYYVQQTERLKNQAQTSYYESQSTSGMMGAVGRLISGAASAIKLFN